MSSQHSFSAVIEDAGHGGAFITIPLDVEAVFGKKRLKVLATFDEVPYRGLATRMGGEHHLIIIRKDIRAAINKGIGDTVAVTLQEDTEPRVVELPDDFAHALQEHPQAHEIFHALAYTHQREYLNWITEAKKPETRQRRIEKGIEILKEHRTR